MPRYVQSRRASGHMCKLLTAIRAGNDEGFREILEREGLPSARNAADLKLLKKALVYGRARMAQALLERGCRAYSGVYAGNSALHLAASRRNCAELVRRLLGQGARVDQKNRKQETPLHVAFASAEGKVVDLMLEQHLRHSFCSESNGIGLTYLHIAAARPQLRNVRCLVEIGDAPVNCQIDMKADSPYAGFTPLHMAVWFDRPKVAELLLLNYGADLWACDSQGSTPLHLALERRNVQMLELLFAYDYKREDYVNALGLSHFMAAACVCGKPSVALDYLLNPANSKTAMTNERVDSYGDQLTYPFKNYTPLHFAVEYGSRETVQLLLANGARCRSHDTDRLMPGDLAVLNNFQRAADLYVMHCLQRESEWSPVITHSRGHGEGKVDEVDDEMICQPDDSGYCEDDDGDEELAYWEDDIGRYIL